MVAKAQKASQIVYANLIARKSILPTHTNRNGRRNAIFRVGQGG